MGIFSSHNIGLNNWTTVYDINKKSLPMFYYDISERVVYVKSFSKAFMPGIRVGAVVLHEKLKKEFLKHKRHYDLHTSVLAQGGLEIFINSGMYNNHIKKVQKKYKIKMDYFRRCLKDIDTEGAEIFIPKTGFLVWLKLDKTINANTLARRLKEKDIYVAPAKRFFIGNNPNENSLRICISKLSQEKIKIGIRILFEEIYRMKKEH